MSHWLTAASPLVIAHRGASASAPENSLSAFALAVDQGADAIELDVRLSSDGWPVVMHDATVDRTTNGRGAVSRLTVKQLHSLDAGDGRPVPTLDQVFEMFGPTILYNVELKEQGLGSKGLAAAIADLIEGHHLEDLTLVSSFNPLTLRRCRSQLTQRTPTALIHRSGMQKYTHRLAKVQADHPHTKLVDKAYMTWARQGGYRVHVWTVDNPTQAQRLARLGVNGIITNHPRLIRDSLETETYLADRQGRSGLKGVC